MAFRPSNPSIPTKLERKALRALLHAEWASIAQVYSGPKTHADLVAKGWMEYLPGSTDRVRITGPGRAAYNRPIPARGQRRLDRPAEGGAFAIPGL
ncbi:hypothetical protein M446_3616 [Methylobacterium sp. 4-46]|uniref:hypothetical protein n=1 Tax=unclassified Methylobacterium TaxID=2615210 RepID=UPI000165C663|nr:MULTISPECIES: hypothetical protein [Methylobacterium]ACA17997.1 hypothetical protein M446_3616 [Methylobacterium sp. 4-46]WFT77299.1 hypothetical protein QA634_18325 [Methylobacterium nodulans]